MTIKLKIVLQSIFRASRNVPLVKQAKLANTFVCLHSRQACFQRSNVRNYAVRFGVSVTHFCNAAKNFFTQETRICFKIVFVSCWNSIYQLFFTMVKLGQICHFWKEPKSCFFLRPTKSHLNSLSKDDCRIIKYKSVFSLWLDFI